MEAQVSVAELRKQFPFPWNYQQFSNGLIRVLDARGVEVPIPSMVGFLVTVTTIMSNQPEKV
jgi:CRISPR/Cas system CMR subunit Cmr4 (Cas7 group RAMP superfamily)